jgi:hypothetical protein
MKGAYFDMKGGYFDLRVRVKVEDGNPTKDEIEDALNYCLDINLDTVEGSVLSLTVWSVKYVGKLRAT